MTKSKKKLFAVIGLLAALALAATLAYWFKTVDIENPFDTKQYGGTSVEKFTPEPDWEPGEKVTKEVKATNSGDYPIIVRVKLSEKWTLDNEQTKQAYSSQSGFNPAINAAAADLSVSAVHKELKLGTDWVLKSDGYYYYTGVLAPGAATSKLLDSVTLCENADMGTYTTTYYYAEVAANAEAPSESKLSDWTKVPSTGIPTPATGNVIYQMKVVDLDPDKPGYANAHYVLTVTTDFCQACKEAAAGMSPAWNSDVVTTLGIPDAADQ